MSAFPARQDVFPPGQSPTALLGALFGAVEALEAHTGSTALSAGMLTAEGTLSPPGGTFCLLSASGAVPASADRADGLTLPWAGLFDPVPVRATSGLTGADPVAPLFEPVFVRAFRPFTGTYPGAALVTGADGKTLVSLVLGPTDVRLRGGEILEYTFLFCTRLL